MLDSDTPWVSVTTCAFVSNREMAPLCGHVLVLYFLIQQRWTEVGQQNCSMHIIFIFIFNQERIEQLSTFWVQNEHISPLKTQQDIVAILSL